MCSTTTECKNIKLLEQALFDDQANTQIKSCDPTESYFLYINVSFAVNNFTGGLKMLNIFVSIHN